MTGVITDNVNAKVYVSVDASGYDAKAGPQLFTDCDYYAVSAFHITQEGPEDPHLRNSRFRRSRDLAHASIPLAQTPWGLTGRTWLQAGAQWVVIVVLPPLNSLGIDSRNDLAKMRRH